MALAGLRIDLPSDSGDLNGHDKKESCATGDGSMLYDLFEVRESNRQPHIVSFPLIRVKTLGQGSSSVVYKSVLLKTLTVTAEKVFVINDPAKRLQLLRELGFLQKTLFSSAPHYSDILSADGKDGSSTSSTTAPTDQHGGSCPYIVPLLEVFSNPLDGTLSMCLEYMDGGSLQSLVDIGGCQNEIALASIAFQMLSGLNFLHSQRLIHRDVKPSNALLSSSGRVKLADFGLTRSLDSGHSLAESFVGTFLYMSPERLAGEPYSFLSDVWSLGITLFSVILGKYPYPEVSKKGYWELLHATQRGPPPLPDPSLQLSAPLACLLSAACHHDVSVRPSAAQLLGFDFVSPSTYCSSHGLLSLSVIPAGNPRTLVLRGSGCQLPQQHQLCVEGEHFQREHDPITTNISNKLSPLISCHNHYAEVYDSSKFSS